MDQFWMFLGSYWWLVFPLMGVAGGAARGWERAAKARHRRRLEIIAAKQGTLPAQVATASEPRPITRPSPLPTQLEKAFAQHDAVTSRWLEYELDVAKIIDYPSISDGRQPLTAAFLRAKKVADGLRPPSAEAKVTADQVAEYRTAVTDYEVAFDLAEREARRQKDAAFSDPERKRLAKAKQLLTVAVDEAATPAERQLAYRRVREEIDGLLAVSDEAIVILEKKVALELPPGQ
ncbi:hypothetical protein [Microbacterium sp. No. 7]|uniref:hypothetical protein n=1 Tax=Microbacterium sp. No. 7 TaxID=1714373 RepID=UPI0012E27D63|nr:hypothetical protein [Microbacterium sp. No. 7]